jgi:nucleoside-diphosphate-sugar epimerase
MNSLRHYIVTGGAGFLGSSLVGELLRRGNKVTVLDCLLFGGESLLSFMSNPNFHFVKTDIWEPRALQVSVRSDWPSPDGIVHLAGLAGFPACQAVGKQVAWRYNVEATEHVFKQAVALKIPRFIYISTYSNYGLGESGEVVTEETPLNPQSLYAETKVASEKVLENNGDSSIATVIFRLTSVYGLSPRPRFDLIVNQFVWEAFRNHELLIYQRGYSRSFIHIQDAVAGIIMGLEAPEDTVQGEIFNLGAESGNLTKDQVVELILKRLPETTIYYKDLTFGGDMGDITISIEKIKDKLGFKSQKTVDDGIRELLDAIQLGLVKDPADSRYRNARFIVQ